MNAKFQPLIFVVKKNDVLLVRRTVEESKEAVVFFRMLTDLHGFMKKE